MIMPLSPPGCGHRFNSDGIPDFSDTGHLPEYKGWMCEKLTF
jgi:hypothetical protein